MYPAYLSLDTRAQDEHEIDDGLEKSDERYGEGSTVV